MGLGLGSKLSKGSGLITPGIITDNLVLKHNYSNNGNIPVSDGAAYFDGDDYIDIQLAGNTAFAGDFTISAWIYRIAEDEYHTIVGADDGTGDEVRLYIQKSSVGSDLILAMGPDDSSGGAKYTHAVTAWTGNYDSKWTHVAATYEDGAQKVYINGLDDTDTGSDNTRTHTINLADTVTIGSLKSSSDHDFLGYICNVGIWTRVLTQAEIQSIMWKNYAGLTDTEKTNLVSWWNLDEAVGNSIGRVTSGIYKKQVLDNHGAFSDNLLVATSGGSTVPLVDFEDASTSFNNYGTATTHELSGDVTYGGSQSLHIITKDSGWSGTNGPMYSNNPDFSSTSVGDVYLIEGYIYRVSGSGDIKLFARGGDGTYWYLNGENITPSSNGVWEKFSVYYYEPSAGSGAHLNVSVNSSIEDFYLDNISLKKAGGNPGVLL